MTKTIEFPKIDQNVELCFVRRYRQNSKTNYIFSRAELHKGVAKELTKWLKEKVTRHQGKKFPNYNPIEYGNVEYIDLSILDSWKKYKKVINPAIDLERSKILN